jgi:hypothetical protein
MAYTQTDVDALKGALASGVLEVEYAGRKTRFRSQAEMLQQLQLMQDEVAPSPARPRYSDVIFDRGV